MASNLCLPKSERKKISSALKSGDIKIASLHKMSDAELKAIFSRFVGDDLAGIVTAKFEQARLSTQKVAYSNWIKSVTTAKDPVRRNMLKKVERVKKTLTPAEEVGFQKELAEMKLGIGVTEEEAEAILRLKKDVDVRASKWNKTRAKVEQVDNPLNKDAGWTSTQERLEYGFALDDFKEYVGGLKTKAKEISLAERFNPKNYGRNIIDAASVTKSLVATLDNSFIGRQGIKALLRGDYKIWANTAGNSFKDFGKELMQKSPGLFKSRSDAVMRGVRADIFSRPNAMNGKYNAAKNGYGLGVLKEEVFPTSLPEKIPLIGRVFKASETAFSGSAVRMRGDLADAVIAAAEQNGVDVLDEVQASAFGKLVSSMTGRGEIGRLGAIGKEINALLFSVRFLKSNFDTLTAHLFDKTITPEARKLAVQSTLKIASSITALLTFAKMLDPDSVDFDPRGSKFGQICTGEGNNRCFDITGGMRGLVTLGSRLVPTFHNGEFGFFTKSAASGKFTKMTGEKFGERTALDTFESFFEGKLSPAAGALRDIWKGQDFQGDKPTFVSTTLGLLTPISADTLVRELEEGNDDIVVAMIAELLGVSNFKTSFRGSGKKWDELKAKKGDKIYHTAINDMSLAYNKKADKLMSTARWDKMTTEDRNKALTKIKADETSRVLAKYGGIR